MNRWPPQGGYKLTLLHHVRGHDPPCHLHLHRANERAAAVGAQPRRLAMAFAFYDNTYALLGCLARNTLFYTNRYRHLVRFWRPQAQPVHPRAAPHHAWSQVLRDLASRPEAIA